MAKKKDKQVTQPIKIDEPKEITKEEELMLQLDELEKSIEIAKQEYDKVQKELEKVLKQKEETQKKVDELTQHLKDAEKEINEQKKKAQAEIDEQKKKIEKKEAELKEKEKELIEQQNEQAKQQNEIDRQLENARQGFQTELRKERIAFDNSLAEDRAELSRQREELKAEKERVEKECQTERARIDKELKTYKEKGLKAIDDELQAQRDEIKQEKEKLHSKELDLERQQVELETAQEAAKASKERYEKQYAKIDEEVEQRLQSFYQDLIKENETYRSQCNKLSKEKDELRKEKMALIDKLKSLTSEDTTGLKEENETLKQKLKAIYEQESLIVEKLRKHGIDAATLSTQLLKLDAYDRLEQQYKQCLDENGKLMVENSRAQVKKEELELANDRANRFENSYVEAIAMLEKIKKPTRSEKLSKFSEGYSDFDKLLSLRKIASDLTEVKWLDLIMKGMKDSGIIISRKLLYAFHTSIKIHEWSPLVVLAGVSGTGKSELPRQYAHHGGMNFISVPVKPDWDSMQSLFGYYNSIENKFEATDLCKAIYHMKENGLDDTMLLVLLDEMNLAYVELYFSDLLSKFETIRGTKDAAVYEIDLGASDKSEEMKIGKNILWVGTMNEDETTKALSDKVVDRSTLLTFPRPTTLVSRNSDVEISPRERYLPKSVWEKWCHNTLDEANVKGLINIEEYRSIVELINEQMSKLNRNLGHRVWQSIERYVFSHPLVVDSKSSKTRFKEEFDSAFAEAVAFKIMPKLRGLEVSGETKKVLDDIGNIIAKDIPLLVEDYKHAMGLSSKIFQWSSAMFMDEKGE